MHESDTTSTMQLVLVYKRVSPRSLSKLTDFELSARADSNARLTYVRIERACCCTKEPMLGAS